MRLQTKKLGISTGGPLIVVVNEHDAKKLDLHPNDRIKLIRSKKVETVVVDIAKGASGIAPGKIGVFEEVAKSLSLKSNQFVDVSLANKPRSLEHIKKKLDGISLSEKEINQIVEDIVKNKLSDTELTYFVAATYCNPNTLDETVALTRAMVNQGDQLKLSKKVVVDKHCIGGIPGNRTTLVVVPIIAAAGYTIPKTSSRAITSPAGTADTMEVLCPVSFSLTKMKDLVKKTNACIVWGGALNLAPADDKIITVEKALMIDAESQLLSSIMAKKHSVSSTHVIIDIPVGPNSKVASKKKGADLKKKFEEIGKKLGMKLRVVLTNGDEPIGHGIGPTLEARDVLKVLRQDPDRPKDLEKKSIAMATKLLELIGEKNPRDVATNLLKSKKAYQKMKQIIKAQGGNDQIKPEEIPLARFEYDITAKKSGKVKAINNLSISKLSRIAGAPVSAGAGIYLYKHIGDPVKKGERLMTIYAASKSKIGYVKKSMNELDSAITY